MNIFSYEDGVRIAEAMTNAKSGTCLRIPAGNYLFPPVGFLRRDYPISNTFYAPLRPISLLLEDKQDIELDFRGARLLFQGWTLPLVLDGCKNITVKNCTLDWIDPPAAEGTVLQADTDSVLIRIDPDDHRYQIRDKKLLFSAGGVDRPCWSLFEFDGTTGEARGDCSGNYEGAEWLDGPAHGTVRLQGRFTVPPRIGNRTVFRFGDRTQTGVFCTDCAAIRFENVTVHTACGIGIVCQFCRDLAFDRVRMIPTADRIFSTHDDGLQCVSCSGQIRLRDCAFRGTMDDCVNIHGTETVIDKIDGNVVYGRFAQACSAGFPNWATAGDMISFAERSTLNSVGRARIKSYALLDRFRFTITFSDPLPPELSDECAMENLANTPEVDIRGCDFGSGRARGLLVSSPQAVMIAENRFHTSGAAILCSGDANYWFESGACENVVIQKNEFSAHCLSAAYEFCSGVISLHPVIQEPERSRGYHRNIAITSNVFHYAGKPLLYALCADGVNARENTVVCAEVPDMKHLWQSEYCKNVTIEGNITTVTR